MTTAANPQPIVFPTDDTTPLPLRGDTLLGVCEAVGQDLGINPNWLRIPFAALLLWNPVVIVGGYLGLAVIVGITRLLLPVARRQPTAMAEQAAEPATAPAVGKAEQREEELLAA